MSLEETEEIEREDEFAIAWDEDGYVTQYDNEAGFEKYGIED